MSQDSIIQKARLVVRDFGLAFRDSFTGDGTRTEFDLSQEDVDAATLAVTVDGVAQTVTTDYSLDDRAGVVYMTTAPAADAVLVVSGTGHQATEAEDLTGFVEIAFDIHIKGRSPAPTMDDLDTVEEYMVGLLAAVQSLWAQVAEAAQETDVNTPEGMHIPAGQRFQQLLALIQAMEAEYTKLSAMLNVGLYAIQVLTLRRVSRTTNKLVPVYVEQEFDDYSTPVRVYPPIPSGTV